MGAAPPMAAGDSWRDAAGRQQGRAGYQFGDFSRSLLRKARHLGAEAAELDWQNLSGRVQGERTYQVGDISRAVARTLVTNIFPRKPDDDGEVLTFKGDLSVVWRMFFDQTRQCGLRAVSLGLLPLEDVEAQEPYLFIGLPGLCFLELVARSFSLQGDRLQLASGETLDRDRVPNEAGAPELFEALIGGRRELLAARLAPDELHRLRLAVLRAGGGSDERQDDPMTPARSASSQDRSALISRVASVFQHVATDVSQLPFFRSHFLEVLSAITAAEPEESQHP